MLVQLMYTNSNRFEIQRETNQANTILTQDVDQAVSLVFPGIFNFVKYKKQQVQED